MSSRKFSDDDPWAFRRHHAEVWKTYLRSNFKSAAMVAELFGVEATTAEKWWAGNHSPQGWAVDFSYQCLGREEF